MALSKYFPVPSDRMGFLWTLTSVSECYVIEFGPAGTTHFAIEGVMELNAEHKMNVYTTHISEVDITFGRHEKLSGAIKEVDGTHQPKYIFVMASSVSALIGIDIESICLEMQQEVKAKLIPVSTGGYDGDYNLGVEQALTLLVETMTKENASEENLYNIIGCTIDSYNFLSDRTEIENILHETFGMKLNTCFTAYTSVEEIEQAAKAKYNIVIRREGLKCAEYMKEHFNIPYVYGRPYGGCATLAWLKEIAQVFEKKVNMDYVKGKAEEIKEHSSNYRRYITNFTSKEVLLYGEYDTVLGLKVFMEELGLNAATLYIKHEMANLPEAIKAKPTEAMLKEELKKDYHMVMGDDVLHRMSGDKHFLQIANPNMDSYNFYRYTPLLGFNGAVRILQDLMNFERKV